MVCCTAFFEVTSKLDRGLWWPELQSSHEEMLVSSSSGVRKLTLAGLLVHQGWRGVTHLLVDVQLAYYQNMSLYKQMVVEIHLQMLAVAECQCDPHRTVFYSQSLCFLCSDERQRGLCQSLTTVFSIIHSDVLSNLRVSIPI